MDFILHLSLIMMFVSILLSSIILCIVLIKVICKYLKDFK